MYNMGMSDIFDNLFYLLDDIFIRIGSILNEQMEGTNFALYAADLL